MQRFPLAPFLMLMTAMAALIPAQEKGAFQITHQGFETLARVREQLGETPWQSVEPGKELRWRKGHTWLEYRAALVAGRGYATPYLTGVTLGENVL